MIELLQCELCDVFADDVDEEGECGVCRYAEAAPCHYCGVGPGVECRDDCPAEDLSLELEAE